MPAVTLILGRHTRDKALAWVKHAPDGTALIFKRKTRSLEQNSTIHGLLTDISKQVVWHGRKLTVEAWKDVMCAAYRSAKHGLEIVPGIDGGFVMLGMHTSEMTVEELSELIELTLAFGAERGVSWTDAPQKEQAA
jgi:hypothetical protein